MEITEAWTRLVIPSLKMQLTNFSAGWFVRIRLGSLPKNSFVTSEREARSEFLLIYTKNLSMSGRPARRPAGPPAGRGHAFERLISLEP